MNSSAPSDTLRSLSGKKARLVVALLGIAALTLAVFRSVPGKPAETAQVAAVKPALSVAVVLPQTEEWPVVLAANGDVAAWQEAVIGPEVSNYRITEVRAQVGDHVRKGQVLARIASDTVASELAEARAAVAELEAGAAEARSNAERARELREKGFYSAQLHVQYQTAAHTASARLDAARARLRTAGLRMDKTSVVAPDDGVISAHAATVGSLTQTGQELFRLIRGGRLEWRAEVPSADLGKVRAGAPATLTGPAGETVRGAVRSVAPSVDPQTRNGLVYVDLPTTTAVRAGMFARGQFELGRGQALTLPQSAVVPGDGFAYVFRLEGDEGGKGSDLGRVARAKVALGRRVGERVEVVSGLEPRARVVERGAGFLADGDLVRILRGEAK